MTGKLSTADQVKCCEQCDTTENVAEYWWIEDKNEKWLLCEDCGIKEGQDKCDDDDAYDRCETCDKYYNHPDLMQSQQCDCYQMDDGSLIKIEEFLEVACKFCNEYTDKSNCNWCDECREKDK